MLIFSRTHERKGVAGNRAKSVEADSSPPTTPPATCIDIVWEKALENLFGLSVLKER
jgi:hypothetical protein